MNPPSWAAGIVLVFAAYGVMRWVKYQARMRASNGWPIIEATTEGGRVVGIGRGGFVAQIDYSFSVNGEYYAGQWEQGAFRDPDDAQAIVDRLGGKKRVFICYDPADPARSVMRDDDQQSAPPPTN